MAVTHSASLTQTVNSTPISFNAGSGSDRFLVVGVLKQSNRTTTGVTYNGVALTKVATLADANVSSGEENTLWVSDGFEPASGANNLALTFSGSGTFLAVATLWDGADQTLGYESVTTSSSAASAAGSVTVTSVTDNCVISGFIRTGTSWTADGNTTKQGTSNTEMGYSTSAVSPAGAQAIGYTNSTTRNLLALAVRPVQAASGSSIKSIAGLLKADQKSMAGILIG
jgi:hypothetical protein